MSIGYLDILDELLANGVAPLGERFTRAQVEFVADRLLPGGGFPGRQGEADSYYTDFAVRILALLARDHFALSHTGHYLSNYQPRVNDVVSCFSLLHASRLLAQCGIVNTLDDDALHQVIVRQQLPTGGFCRPGGETISAYITFLAALCFEMLDSKFPCAEQVIPRIIALQCPDGGFTDLPGDRHGQTNATAAAVAFLVMQNALDEACTYAAIRFLVGMQAEDGGLRAHAAAPMGDLLSTFTGLLTLTGLDTLDKMDISALARFVRQLLRHFSRYPITIHTTPLQPVCGMCTEHTGTEGKNE